MALLGMNSDGISSRDCSSTPPVIFFGTRSGVSILSSGRENWSSGWLSSLLSIEENAAEISKLGSTGFSVH